MAFTDRLPQAWKKIKELIEQMKTKADLGGAVFTGRVTLPSYSRVKASTTGVTNIWLENADGTEGGSLVHGAYTGLERVNGARIVLKDDKAEINKPLLVEGINIKSELSNKADLTGASFSGVVNLPSKSKITKVQDGSLLYIGDYGLIGEVPSATTLRRKENHISIGDDKTFFNKPIEIEGINFSDKITKNRTSYALYGASYHNPRQSSVGTKIRLPFKADSAQMVSFSVRVYQLYACFDILFSGYLYGSTNQWYEPNATLIGHTGNTLNAIVVKMGRDNDGQAYVWLRGEAYRGVAVKDIVVGYGGGDFNDGWEIIESDDAPNKAFEKELLPPLNGNNCPIQKARNGYCKLVNGLIVQWGSSTFVGGGGSATNYKIINFPITFTSQPSVTISRKWANTNTSATGACIHADPNHFRIYSEWGTNEDVSWMAIGY